MQNKASNRRSSYFVRQRIHGNVLALARTASETESIKSGVENILRWEEDGGRSIETNHLMPDPPFVQSVPIVGELHHTSLPWNQKFVIEPFQAEAGIRLIQNQAPIKR